MGGDSLRGFGGLYGNKEKNTARYKVYIVLVGIFASVIVARLFWMQIINGDTYSLQAEQKQMRSVAVKAPRGEIVDRFGKPLVTNKEGYSVQIQKTNLKKDEFDDLLLKIYRLIEEHGAEVLHTFPIEGNPMRFTFGDEYEADAQEKAREDEVQWKKARDLDENMTATETVKKLAEKYGIASKYSDEDLLRLVSLRYEMEKRSFSVSTPFTIATDVDMELVTKLEEDKAEYPCVNIATDYVRQYPNGSLAAHLLGRTGAISDKEYEEMRSLGYKMTDEVGKQGIEKVFEEYLKGNDGYMRLVQTPNGFEEQPEAGKAATAGNYVVLTIDAELQQTLENALSQTIENIRKKGGAPENKSGGDAYCGAAVAMNPQNGEILAMASWPTFDPSSFNKDYQKMLADKNKPMWNRAISGTYPPGSTYKMLTSIAALESGVIDADTIIKDEGVYKYYSDYQPRCWIWKNGNRTHGEQNVSQALANSCNYFFYETGRLMGIETLDKYAKMYGLGEKTGIELTAEEEKGRLAGPEDRAKYKGDGWQPGDTLQAAIGQSDNLFTPIQLANYVSTLVNGGKRYKPHLVKCVRSPSDGSVVYETEPEVLSEVDVSEKNVRAVLEGMLGVTENGTASSAFDGYPIKVGGKTGSAQVAVGSDNGVFTGFAPYDNPQIAVAVVVEHGNSGGDVVPIVKAVLDEYFNNNGENAGSINNNWGTLLP